VFACEALVRRGGIADSIYVDRESHNEVNIRMMTLHRTHRDGETRIGFRTKHRITQDALKDTSRTENESQTGYLVDQEDRDTLKDWVKSHRGGVMQEAVV